MKRMFILIALMPAMADPDRSRGQARALYQIAHIRHVAWGVQIVLPTWYGGRARRFSIQSTFGGPGI